MIQYISYHSDSKFHLNDLLNEKAKVRKKEETMLALNRAICLLYIYYS